MPLNVRGPTRIPEGADLTLDSKISGVISSCCFISSSAVPRLISPARLCVSTPSKFGERRNDDGVERRCLVSSARAFDLVADKCYLKTRANDSRRCDARRARHKVGSLQIRLRVSKKSLCRSRLLLLAENGQRFFKMSRSRRVR